MVKIMTSIFDTGYGGDDYNIESNWLEIVF